MDRSRLGEYLREGVFFTLYGCVKYLPSPLFDPLRYLVLKPFMKRLSSLWIRDGVTVWFPRGISIGQHVSINEWCFLDGWGGLEIGNYCRIAHGCSFISEDHEFGRTDIPIYRQPKVAGKITIGNDVWFGCGVRVTRGVTIGDQCVIGAGSVVVSDIPPGSVAVGVPARVIRSRGGGPAQASIGDTPPAAAG